MHYVKSIFFQLFLFCYAQSLFSQKIPLAEHPRPDFERSQWQNLNGQWAFAFDSLDIGMANGWEQGKTTFNKTILVPFPWGSKLSGLADEADIGWYNRTIQINQTWQGKRIFLTIGASD